MKVITTLILLILLLVYVGMYLWIQRTRPFKLRRDDNDELNLKWVETNFHQNEDKVKLITDNEHLRRQIDPAFLVDTFHRNNDIKYIGLFHNPYENCTSSDEDTCLNSLLDQLCEGACDEVAQERRFAQAKRNIKQFFLLIALDTQGADFVRLAPKIAPHIFTNVKLNESDVLPQRRHKLVNDKHEHALVDFIQKELHGKLSLFNIRNKVKI